LAVVQRSGGQHGADRDIAICHIEMQFVADPACRMALGVALGSDRAVRRQVLWQLNKLQHKLQHPQPWRVLRHRGS
jgi:hypothetical protein